MDFSTARPNEARLQEIFEAVGVIGKASRNRFYRG